MMFRVPRKARSHLSAKNSPQDCFFNAKSPLRVQVPLLAPVAPSKKQERSTFVLLFALVRMMGLEPIRSDSHAPQTCASTSSATSAFRVAVPYGTLILYYNSFVLSTHFRKNVAIFVIPQKHIRTHLRFCALFTTIRCFMPL